MTTKRRSAEAQAREDEGQLLWPLTAASSREGSKEKEDRRKAHNNYISKLKKGGRQAQLRSQRRPFRGRRICRNASPDAGEV
jgi:hypothetical protein